MYEKLIGMSRNDDYTTGNLLNDLYHQNCYKLISTHLSRQANTSIPQKIKFTGQIEKDVTGKLENDDGATMFFNAEKDVKEKK